MLLKNGAFVPSIYALLMKSLKGDCLIATAAAIRIFTINYFFWFQPWTMFGQLRQFVRFTDSQSLVCLMHWVFPNDKVVTSLCNHILAIVAVGFWIAKLFFGISETLVKPTYPFMMHEINKLYHYINHGLLWWIFQSTTTHPNTPFNDMQDFATTIKPTLRYILFYIMLIYIPWYFITGDRIYDV
jgi:hypothetical protein